MANDCSNYIDVKGNAEELLKLYEILNQEDAYLNLKEFTNETDPSYFHLEIEGDFETIKLAEKFIINGDSGWCPALNFIKNLSIEFPNLYFNYSYEEAGCDISGWADIHNGVIEDNQYEYWRGKILMDRNLSLEIAYAVIPGMESEEELISSDMYNAFDEEERTELLQEYRNQTLK